ncbi:MAG: O-antigen ligase family protein [Bacteroidales bacterium]|nr:O-antigen ligase family protein [Bacteroidales bacterium]
MHLTLHTITRNIYILLLSVLMIAMPTSNFFMNMMWVFLLANWIVEGDWRYKWAQLRHNRLLQAVVLIFALHLIGLLWSSNISYGLDDIRKKLPLLAIPLVVMTSRPLEESILTHLKAIFLTTMGVVTLIGVVRFLTIPDLPYRELNPYISHIRFSLEICLALAIIAADIRKVEVPHMSKALIRALMALLGIWLLAFLLLQQSYTGIITLAVMIVVAALRSGNKAAAVATTVLLLGLGGLTACYVNDYYRLRSLSTEPLATHTENGTPYTHRQDGFVERGGYVNNYICDQELYSEWPKHSQVGLDSITEVGYPLYGALVRYLNCMNLAKDSAGICQLSQQDIAAIEKGIANPSYLRQGSPRKFFDQILYEYESGRRQSSIRGFTMLERLELWHNGWMCIKENPWLGVGTGDVVDIAHQRLQETDSPIADTTKHIHNQYLTFILTFGFVGFLLIVFFVARGLRQGQRMPLLSIALAALVLVSFINEDTLETLAGIMLVVVWGSILNNQRNHVPLPYSK